MTKEDLALLPPEIIVSIIQFATISSPTPCQTLVTISLTSRRFHHLVFCQEHDNSVWRIAAGKVGNLPPDLSLDEVIYAGNSSLQKRSWKQLVELILAWKRPFPPATPTLPRSQKALPKLPSPNSSGDWFGRRTVEICCAGEGTRRGPCFSTKEPTSKDDGSAVIQVRNLRGSRTGVVAAVIDPVKSAPEQVAVKTAPAAAFTVTPFPTSAGHCVTVNKSEYTIHRVDPATGKLDMKWFLGKRKPDRFVSCGDLLVCVAFDSPDQEKPSEASHIPSNLMCLRHTGEETKLLWETNISDAWAEDDDYTAFPHLKSFNMTRKYLVALVTRHPTSTLGKLTGTNFLVLDVRTGATLRSLKFKTKSISSISGTARAPFTTAFNHDFLLTDTIAISGGAGGGLLVWEYMGDSEQPLYSIPDPGGSDITKLSGGFPRTYGGLTLSVDGRYLSAATSDRLYVFDLVEKKIANVYDNGRKVSQKDIYVKNPMDDFPGGIWLKFYDWKSVVVKDDAEGDGNGIDEIATQHYWEKVGEGVVYLTDAAEGLRNDMGDETYGTFRIVRSRFAMDSKALWWIAIIIGAFSWAIAFLVLGMAGKTTVLDYVQALLQRLSGGS